MRGDATNWLAVDVVKQHISAAATQVGRFAAADFESTMQSVLDSDEGQDPRWRLGMESPLEAIFYTWWRAMVGDHGWFQDSFALDPQQEIEVGGNKYRLDFVVNLVYFGRASNEFAERGSVWPVIAVEVDGHAFHEKTPEQVAYRNQRDRALQQAGCVVFHFSWSEVTTRPEECIGEVVGAVKERYWVIMRSAQRAAVNEVGAQLVGEADTKES